MEHNITTSGDGSSTLQLTRFNETYHSRNGAYTEAQHIYIKNGLEHLFQTTSCGAGTLPDKSGTVSVGMCTGSARTDALGNRRPMHLNIFDVGFGTALNCILAWAWQQTLAAAGLPYPSITYYGIEKYPIPLTETEQLNYHTIIAQHSNLLPDKLQETFLLMHSCPWEEDVAIPGIICSGNGEFILHKSCADIATLGAEYYREACSNKEKESRCSTDTATALVFYDTFSPATQPELWNEAIFRNIAAGCPAGSVLVTYCSKGTVKQALRAAGFTLERLAGPPGKRHILRGTL